MEKDFEPMTILHKLHHEGIMTEEELETMKKGNDRHERVATLIAILKSKPNDYFEKFLNVLGTTGFYCDLQEILEQYQILLRNILQGKLYYQYLTFLSGRAVTEVYLFSLNYYRGIQ